MREKIRGFVLSTIIWKGGGFESDYLFGTLKILGNRVKSYWKSKDYWIP